MANVNKIHYYIEDRFVEVAGKAAGLAAHGGSKL
jgi:hypothetical protein